MALGSADLPASAFLNELFEQVQIHESRALPLSYRAEIKRMSGFKKINKTSIFI